MVSFQDNLSCPGPDLYGSEVYCKAILSDRAGKFTGVLFIFLEKKSVLNSFTCISTNSFYHCRGQGNNYGFLHVADK